MCKMKPIVDPNNYCKTFFLQKSMLSAVTNSFNKQIKREYTFLAPVFKYSWLWFVMSVLIQICFILLTFLCRFQNALSGFGSHLSYEFEIFPHEFIC